MDLVSDRHVCVCVRVCISIILFDTQKDKHTQTHLVPKSNVGSSSSSFVKMCTNTASMQPQPIAVSTALMLYASK